MRCASFDLLFDDTTNARAAVRTGVKRAGANFVTIAEDAAERQLSLSDRSPGGVSLVAVREDHR